MDVLSFFWMFVDCLGAFEQEGSQGAVKGAMGMFPTKNGEPVETTN